MPASWSTMSFERALRPWPRPARRRERAQARESSSRSCERGYDPSTALQSRSPRSSLLRQRTLSASGFGWARLGDLRIGLSGKTLHDAADDRLPAASEAGTLHRRRGSRRTPRARPSTPIGCAHPRRRAAAFASWQGHDAVITFQSSVLRQLADPGPRSGSTVVGWLVHLRGDRRSALARTTSLARIRSRAPERPSRARGRMSRAANRRRADRRRPPPRAGLEKPDAGVSMVRLPWSARSLSSAGRVASRDRFGDEAVARARPDLRWSARLDSARTHAWRARRRPPIGGDTGTLASHAAGPAFVSATASPADSDACGPPIWLANCRGSSERPRSGPC